MSAAVDLLVFYGLVLLAIWGGAWVGFRPPGAVAALLVLGFCAWSARRRGDEREALGLDRRWLAPCARRTLLWAGPILVVLVLWAMKPPWPTRERLFFGADGPPPWAAALPAPALLFLGLLRYPLWAAAQEFALLSFCANRWRALAGGPWRMALFNGAAFALVHAPNPVLMTACFVAGVIFTRIFWETPHVLPPALAHALAGLCLSVIFRDFTPAMMVGPAYWRYAGGLAGGP